MKASIVKITDEAKLRDTIRRNEVNLIDSGDLGSLLFEYQTTVSQVAGTKRHFIILVDDDDSMYCMDFNIAQIRGMAEPELKKARKLPGVIQEAFKLCNKRIKKSNGIEGGKENDK